MLARKGTLITVVCGIGLLQNAPADAQVANATVKAPVLEVPASEPAPVQDVQRTRIEPALAGGLSVLLPGAGQFYNGQKTKGTLMLAGAAASVIYAVTAGIGDDQICVGSGRTRFCEIAPYQVNGRFWLGLGATAGIQIWSILDAIAVANRRNAQLEGPGPGARLELAPRLHNGAVGAAAVLRLTH
ncbi:MAG: hypothetical protein ACREMA_03635 [Longimicrobiales bacterium]